MVSIHSRVETDCHCERSEAIFSGMGVPPVVIPADAGNQTGPRIGVRGDPAKRGAILANRTNILAISTEADE